MSAHAWRPPVADDWWMVAQVGDDVTRLVELHITTALESNVWHVRGRDADLVIDTANGVGLLKPAIDELSQGRPVIAVTTHGHFDHVGGLAEFDDRRGHPADAEGIRAPFPMRMHRDDFPEGAEEIFDYYGFPVPRMIVGATPSEEFDIEAWVSPGAELTGTVDEGDVIDLGDRRFTVLHVPGHTAGSIALWEVATGLLFTGDAAYVESRMSYDDRASAAASLRRFADLPVRRVHPGHDRSFDRRELDDLVKRELADLES